MQKSLQASVRSVAAAQYIRMSSEHQRFSPDNQKAAIAAYALQHRFEIVATYQDSGKSGLTLKGRPELKRLLSDVLSGKAPFRTVLVLDVSRWGRFQDADQAAHYEYMCREAGVPVRYCCEAFDNDGGAMASIVKHMKRVMAAEYSRELSIKIARAQRQQASLGYKQGGPAVLGTRRQLIDQNGRTRMLLAPGERKGLTTDRVIIVRGSASEVALVRAIFNLYVREDLTIKQVAEAMNHRGRLRPDGRRWTYEPISKILKNELYSGTYVFGRTSNNLGKPSAAAEKEWVRALVMKPIIPPDLFAKAAEKRERTRRRPYSDAGVLEGLRRLLREEGYISGPLIGQREYLPTLETIVRRFGSLPAACKAIGYEKPERAHPGFTRVYSDEDLLAELRRIYNANGKLTAKLIDEDPSVPSSAYFKRRLGGLRMAADRANLRTDSYPRHRSYVRGDGTRPSEAELIVTLRAIYERHGYLTAAIIDADPGTPSAWLYFKTFGGLPEAYSKVGYCSSRAELKILVSRRRRAAEKALKANAAHSPE